MLPPTSRKASRRIENDSSSGVSVPKPMVPSTRLSRLKGPNFRVCDISSMHLPVSASEACEEYQVAGMMRFIMRHELLPASPCVKAATTHKENDQKDY